MSTTLENVREPLTGQPRRRWRPWRRKPTLVERVGDVTGQAGQATSNIAEQVGQTTSNMAEQMAPAVAGVQRRTAFELGRMAGRLPSRPSRAVLVPQGLPEGLIADEPLLGHQADLSAERAAIAAESAAQAAQRATGMMERLGVKMALLAGRAPETPEALAPEAALAAALERESGEHSKGVTESLRRAAMTVGQRVSDLSDGRYGLEAQLPKAGTKQEKKAEKRLKRLAEKEAQAEQPGSSVSWFPWMIGLSLGLVVGLVGVAYWQRRRLQTIWNQTSQRMQQTTETMRQRLEASRTGPQTIQPGTPSAASNITPLGPSGRATEIDRQGNGRMEPTLPY
jgi:hypothetical protein